MDIFEKSYYGNTLESWLISLLIVLAALVLNQLLILLIQRVAKTLATKSNTHVDDLFVESLEKPVPMGVALIALWFAIARLTLSDTVHDIVAKSCQVLIVLNITWFFARFAARLIQLRSVDSSRKRPGKGFYFDERLLPVVKRTITILIWVIGGVTALNNVGVKITTFLGTLGIGGIAFALAAQDTIKNIFGGITIFTDRTFRIGDIIRFDTAEGVVTDIGMRSTRIRTYDQQTVVVPNYKLTDALITNVSSEPGRRIVMELGLTYDTPPEKLREAIEILQQMPKRVPEIKEKELSATFATFSASALVIRFSYFTQRKADIFEARSKVNFEILESFTRAGLSFAYPSTTVYMADGAKSSAVSAPSDNTVQSPSSSYNEA